MVIDIVPILCINVNYLKFGEQYYVEVTRPYYVVAEQRMHARQDSSDCINVDSMSR